MKELCLDNNVLLDNLEALAERFPIAADTIRVADLPIDRRAVEGKRGFPVFQTMHNGKYKNLTSLYEPFIEAETQIRDCQIESSEIIFVFGEAGLFHVEAALAAAKDSSKVVLISANPSNLKLVLATRNLCSLFANERFIVTVSKEISVVREVVNRILLADMYRVLSFTWIVHPHELELQSEEISMLERSLLNGVHHSIFNFNTTMHFEKAWSENFLFNIHRAVTGVSISKFEDTWKNKPVIVVGAGPSLNKNIQLLSRFKDRALILCTDTAYRALQANEIKPTAIVTIDGGTANLKNMENCYYADIPLVMDVYTHWGIAEGSKVPPAVFASNDLHDEWWQEVTKNGQKPVLFSTGGSVATAAFQFACLIGANPIILVGEDLSFPNGEIYADGTVNAGRTLDDVRNMRELHMVTDQKGNTLYTTADYLFYLRWFEIQVKNIESRCINATEGGALYKGFIIQTLAETLTKDCATVLPVEKWLENFQWNSDIDSELTQIERQLKRSLRELYSYSRTLRILANDTNDYQQALQSGDIAKAAHFTKRLEKGRIFLKRLKLASAFLDAYSFKTISEDIRLSDQLEHDKNEVTEEEQTSRSAKQSLKLFRELAERCNESIQMHKDALGVYTNWLYAKWGSENNGV